MSTSGRSTGRESGRSATPSTTALGGRSRVHGLLKDKPDHLLQPPVRIEAEADVPVPSVTDWTRDPQLAAPGLRSCRLVHPRSNDPQLELADAPLHAEQ